MLALEPIAIRDHPALSHHPEYEGKQFILDCGSGIGLSVINAKGDRWHHGLYCEDDSYEVCLIRFTTDNPGENPFEYVMDYEDSPTSDVIGWLSIEVVGELAQRIANEGRQGYYV